MKREHCNNTNNNEWCHCNYCSGRIHNDNCTTKRIKGKDCLCSINGKDATKEYYESYGIGGLELERLLVN